MKTKWDCLFALFELKEARLGAIAKEAGSSPSAASQQLAVLLKNGLIIKEKGAYTPNKSNTATWQIFSIMKFCRSRGINYNLFLN